MCFGRLNSESQSLIKHNNYVILWCWDWPQTVYLQCLWSWFSSRERSWQWMFTFAMSELKCICCLLGILLPRTQAGAWRAKEQKKCFTTCKLLITLQDTLTIFGCEEVLEFHQEEIWASWWRCDAGKVSFEKLPVAAILLRQVASVSTYADDSPTAPLFFLNMSDLTSSFIWRRQIVDCCLTLWRQNRVISGYCTTCLRGWLERCVWERECTELNCWLSGTLMLLRKKWRQAWRYWCWGAKLGMFFFFLSVKTFWFSLLSCFDQRDLGTWGNSLTCTWRI